jgi:proton glutamate symport protein
MQKALIILAALLGGILLGVTVGGDLPVAVADTIGTLWLNALKMTVIPLVVALLITGIAQTASAARAGRLAGRGVLTMMIILWSSSALAAIGIPALLSIFPMPVEAAAALRAALGHAAKPDAVPPFADFVRGIIPTNPFAAAANDAILPLIVFTAAFAFATIRLPEEKRGAITNLFAATADAMVIIIGWVLAIAPLGVFALGYVVGAKAGTAAIGALAHYVFILSSLGVIVWACAFVLAVLGARIGVPAFFKASVEAQAVAISTQSSLASLPAMLKGVKALGVPEAKADIILPIAVAIFRATGPAMNFGVALYIAHWFGVPLGPAQIAVGIAAGATTTLGAVSLPGSISFVSSCAPICLAIGAPVEPLALLIAVETFPDIFRTLGNVTMDMAVTATVAARSKD